MGVQKTQNSLRIAPGLQRRERRCIERPIRADRLREATMGQPPPVTYGGRPAIKAAYSPGRFRSAVPLLQYRRSTLRGLCSSHRVLNGRQRIRLDRIIVDAGNACRAPTDDNLRIANLVRHLPRLCCCELSAVEVRSCSSYSHCISVWPSGSRLAPEILVTCNRRRGAPHLLSRSPIALARLTAP